jgi:uncharacterized protein (DUF2384 family)
MLEFINGLIMNNKTINKVEEPMVAYGVSLLGLLYGLNFSSLEEMHLPGSSIVELQKQTKLSPQDMAGVVGVSKSKYYELVQLKDIGTKNLDALVDFATLWKKGLTAFDNDDEMLSEWMTSRNSNLGNIKPVELLSTRVGRRELEKAFNRIEYSTYG